ncbi:MAG: hypothetical protein P4N41_22590 [Negativicutes bacterium]|nr:hypothetical protein [Negativicutes bacterium]
MIIELWGHLFHTPELATAPHLCRLSRIERFFAPQRLGEAVLRREVRAGRVVMDRSRRQRKQRLVWAWLHRTRGRLPVLEALGGRIRLPILRRMTSWLFYRLGRLGILPPFNGFLDHGRLIDRIGVSITLTYSGRLRAVWLDRILLHKNQSLHLVGIDLGLGEQRTFRLDRVDALEIPMLGSVERDDLYWELQALCLSRADWLGYWNRHQAKFGRPPAPPIGPVGRVLETAGRLSGVVALLPGLLARARATAVRAYRVRRMALHALIRSSLAVRHLPSRKALRRAALLAEMPTWRRRLLRAIATVEAGGRDQITCLLPMNALLADSTRCLAYLRHLVALTIKEAEADPSGHPEAQGLLAEALSLAPVSPRPIPLVEWQAAQRLMLRLKSRQPGSRRIGIHARRPQGADARLLLCQCFLMAVYGLHDHRGDAPWNAAVVRIPKQWGFYRASAYFIARWDDLRFHVDATSAPRLRAIVDWWDVETARKTGAHLSSICFRVSRGSMPP